MICIPNLPGSMLEYVNMCNQCVIGVVLQKDKDDNQIPLTQEDGSEIELFDIM